MYGVFYLTMSERRSIPSALRSSIFERDNKTCVGIDKFACPWKKIAIPIPESQLDIDHKIAICLGGTNDASNLQLLCKSCHAEKTKRDLQYRVLLNKQPGLDQQIERNLRELENVVKCNTSNIPTEADIKNREDLDSFFSEYFDPVPAEVGKGTAWSTILAAFAQWKRENNSRTSALALRKRLEEQYGAPSTDSKVWTNFCFGVKN